MTVRPQDLGGRHGFGPVQIEQDEPVFHADWEASVIAGILATISAGLYNVDQFREGIDELEPSRTSRSATTAAGCTRSR